MLILREETIHVVEWHMLSALFGLLVECCDVTLAQVATLERKALRFQQHLAGGGLTASLSLIATGPPS